jgi:hypothetical protein
MKIWAGILLVAMVSACGYRPLYAAFPEGKGKIAIPLIINNTAKAGLVGPFTQALREQTALTGIRVVKAGAPRLIAIIVDVTVRPGQLAREGKNLYPLDKIQTISVVARIEAEDGRVIVPEQRFTHGGRSLAGETAQTEVALEADRRIGILDDIAEMIVSYMFVRI